MPTVIREIPRLGTMHRTWRLRWERRIVIIILVE
jgi:hypothetical protein